MGVVVVGRVGDWPENEAGEGRRELCGSGVSIAGMEHHRAEWTGDRGAKRAMVKSQA